MPHPAAFTHVPFPSSRIRVRIKQRERKRARHRIAEHDDARCRLRRWQSYNDWICGGAQSHHLLQTYQGTPVRTTTVTSAMDAPKRAAVAAPGVQPHRSKMVLTRRVHSWTLSPPASAYPATLRGTRRKSARKRAVIDRRDDASHRLYETENEHDDAGEQLDNYADAGVGSDSDNAGAEKSEPPYNEVMSEAEPLSKTTPSRSSKTGSRTIQPAFVLRRPSSFTPRRRAADPSARFLQLTSAETAIPSGWRRTAARWGVLNEKSEKRTRVVLSSKRLFQAPIHGPAQPETTARRAFPQPAGWSGLRRTPRVIAIGDVHGCLSELKALLRLADYRAGDQVVMLGDLVAKGPDSVGVVRLAREIGARTVRGNHDYEVVRWWEGRRAAHIHAADGRTRPVGGARDEVSMEHARIARSLSAAEHGWLLDAPWFIECAEMGHLFVHAGFIPGVKLTQQNPRLMMNMRSVLEDGTVTARNVDGCEWARLWKGPQKVVFGHDAFRGLQMHPFAMGIDTGCVYGGRLTALILPDNRLVSVAAQRAYICPKRFRTLRDGPASAVPAEQKRDGRDERA